MADALLDETLDYAIRRRIPRLLATCENRRAWDGLFEGLNDPHFEIRFRCSRALDAMHQRHPEFRPEPAVVYPLIARELRESPTTVVGDGDDGSSAQAEGGSEGQVSHSLAHVFALLGLILPRDAVRTAFRALHTDDSRLRALAVEYLGSSVPREIRDRLCDRMVVSPPPVKEARERSPNLSRVGPGVAARPDDAGTGRAEGQSRGAGS